MPGLGLGARQNHRRRAGLLDPVAGFANGIFTVADETGPLTITFGAEDAWYPGQTMDTGNVEDITTYEVMQNAANEPANGLVALDGLALTWTPPLIVVADDVTVTGITTEVHLDGTALATQPAETTNADGQKVYTLVDAPGDYTVVYSATIGGVVVPLTSTSAEIVAVATESLADNGGSAYMTGAAMAADTAGGIIYFKGVINSKQVGYIWGNTNTHIRVLGPRLRVQVFEAGGTAVILTASPLIDDATWLGADLEVLVSINAGGQSLFYYRLDGGTWVEDADVTTAFTNADWRRLGLGLMADRNGANPADAGFYSFQVWPLASGPDISLQSVRDHFATPDDAVTEYGTPELDFRGEDANDANNNIGSGADFTQTGTFTIT